MTITKYKLDIDRMIEDVKDIAIHSKDFYRSPETDIGILASAVYVLLQQIKGADDDSTGIN